MSAPIYADEMHWTERAERVGLSKRGRDRFLLGEDDNGEILVPSLWRANWWQTRYSPWKPWHWPVWVSSRLRRKLAWLERP